MMSGPASLDPTSQPFFPGGVLGMQHRRESTPSILHQRENGNTGFLVGTNTEDSPNIMASQLRFPPPTSLTPGAQDVQNQNHGDATNTSYSPNFGPIGRPTTSGSGTNTPSRMRSVDGLGFRMGSSDHMRYPSSLSVGTNTSYASARSSPSPPDHQPLLQNQLVSGIQRRDSKSQLLQRRGSSSLLQSPQNQQSYHPLHHQHSQPHLPITSPFNNDLSTGILPNSFRSNPDNINSLGPLHPKASHSSLVTSTPLRAEVSQMSLQSDNPGQGVMSTIDQNDPLHSFLRNVNADRSYPTIESRLNREGSHVGHIVGEADARHSVGGGAGSGLLSTYPQGDSFKPDELDVVDEGVGENSGDTANFTSGNFNPLGDYFDLVPGGSFVSSPLSGPKGIVRPSMGSLANRSNSLSVPGTIGSPAPIAQPTRKSSVASFTSQDYQLLQQQQRRQAQSPLPSSFLNYTIDGGDNAITPNGGEGAITPGATAVGALSADNQNDNSNVTTPNTSSTASIAGINPLMSIPPTSTSAPSLNPLTNSGSSGQQPADARSNPNGTSPSSSVRSSSAFPFDRGDSPGNLSSSQTFETQAKSSPFLNDILDRLIRYEYATRDIQRELGTLSKHVEFLVSRALASEGVTASNAGTLTRKDSFSVSPSLGNGNGLGQNTGMTPNAGNGSLMGLLPAAGSSTSSLLLPPGTPSNARDKDEEIRMLNQRINTLTSSVSQLLQLQNHMQTVSPGAPSAMNATANFGVGSPAAGSGLLNPPGYNGIAPGAMGTPPLNNGGGLGTPDITHSPMSGVPGVRADLAMGSNGVVGRPSPRAPIPVRTWSSGSMEMGLGLGNSGGVGIAGRDGPAGPGVFRDKRRSIATIGRRDSAGASLDAEWNGGLPRDPGNLPNISKWEHLALVPELLRSIAKYGVGPPNKIQQRALPFLLRGADIIAQAPPTQERIAAYVIPAINAALSLSVAKTNTHRGPVVVIISTTVDQATQAQRMVRDLGGPIGVRSALAVGTGGDVTQELRLLQQNIPHILCGTPKKLHALFTEPHGGVKLPGGDVRFLVLDEVDQLIARNQHEYVYNIVKLFPPPRSKPLVPTMGPPGSTLGTFGTPITNSPATSNPGGFSPFETNSPSTLGQSGSSFPAPVRRFSSALTPSPNPEQASGTSTPSNAVERQTALFSNTVPQDVLNLANTIQLREPVRVLVRRDGNVTQTDSNTGSRGLRQFYLYLAFTGGGGGNRGEGSSGLGIIGSGRGNNSTSNAATTQAREWKLDALVDLFDDVDVTHAIVNVGGLTSLESVAYKLATRGLETIPLHSDMNPQTRLTALNKFRGTGPTAGRPQTTRVLIVYDVYVKYSDLFQVPLVINYDLPKAVEDYAPRVAPAIANPHSRSGVVVNFVTATGGDVEMLRSIECFYKIKCPEVPMSLRDVL